MSLPLILASSSPYRRQLLNRLGVPYHSHSPEIDESPYPDENPSELARRLAHSKALALTADYPQHLVIGSDQVASIDGHILGKPGNSENAAEQLRRSSGKEVVFFTATALLNSQTGNCQIRTDVTRVLFRKLSKEEIHRYLALEQPFDCAGSFKAEGLGITLFDKILSEDPTALIGLPLIGLCAMLRQEGLALL